MDGGIDAAGTAANDSNADVGELVTELAGDLHSVGGGHAGTHESHGIFVLRQEGAFDVEDDGRIVNLAQQLRVFGIILDDNVAAEIRDAFELGFKVDVLLPTGNGF